MKQEKTGNSQVSLRTLNICPLFSFVVFNKLATIKELDEYYSFNDVLDMVEILNVNFMNEQEMIEKAKKDK